jgi:hypothetical protein
MSRTAGSSRTPHNSINAKNDRQNLAIAEMLISASIQKNSEGTVNALIQNAYAAAAQLTATVECFFSSKVKPKWP